MRNVHIDYPGSDLNYQRASLLASDAAKANKMRDPTIIAWHRHSTHDVSPRFEGGNPDAWWEKYGTGNGGRLEVSVGDEYDFVLMDARGFETLGEMPVKNLTDAQGNEYVCFIPILGKAATPDDKACVPLDDWAADQY